MDAQEMNEYLSQINRNTSHKVYPRLNKGDLVQKAGLTYYEIDDPQIFKNLGDFAPGAVPFGEIYRRLKPRKTEIMKMFDKKGTKRDGKTVLPYSKIFQSNIGECVEKSILAQLAAQESRDSFLINGLIGFDNDVGVDYHAFNVIYKEEKPFLVDVTNPLASDDDRKVLQSYIAPLTGIENGEFVVPEEWKQGRIYYLF